MRERYIVAHNRRLGEINLKTYQSIIIHEYTIGCRSCMNSYPWMNGYLHGFQCTLWDGKTVELPRCDVSQVRVILWCVGYGPREE